MFRKTLVVIVCMALLSSLIGCNAVDSFFSSKDPGSVTGDAGNAGDPADIAVPGDESGNDTDIEIPESEYLLLMRISPGSDAGESFDVLELTEYAVTYRYYDYSDPENPELKEKTIPFEEVLAKENGVDKYRISIYLFDGVNEFEMELTGDLEEKMRNYPEFRKTLGTVLGKPFSRPPSGDVITSEDINVSAQKNTGSAPEEDGDGSGNNDGTGGGDDEGNDGSLPTGPDQKYEVLGTVYIETHGSSRYRLEYPQISGLGDEAIRSSINSIIKEEALKVLTYCMEDLALTNVNIDYHITRKSPALLSIEYQGTGEIAGVQQPYNLYFTSNIDTRTGDKIRLKDIVEISDKFTGRFLDSRFMAVGGLQAEALGQLDNQTLKELFTEADSVDNIAASGKPYVFSYFTTNCLGISITFRRDPGDPSDSGQATGDQAASERAVFEIRYMDLEDEMAGDDDIREELLSTDVTEVAVLDGIDFEGFGQMKLTVGKYKDNGIMKLKLLLEDRSNGYIYILPELTDIQWNLRNLALLEVLDANDDGLSDIVIIAHYVTGVGEEGMSPFSAAHIYFQERHGFVRDTELEQKINKDEFATTEDVVKLIRKYGT